jgi:hypothetical protein
MSMGNDDFGNGGGGDDRFAALEKYSRRDDATVPMIPAQAFSGGGERIVGAQAVAVRRDEIAVLAKLRALGNAAGDAWYYRFPVRNNRENRTDFVEGGSIKMANDLARLYGNCDVDIRVSDVGERWIMYARFTDYETGFSMARPFQQRKTAARMGRDEDRNLDIAFQIGVSKAIRNVVLNALQTFADEAFRAAKNSLVEKIGKNLDGWRTRLVARFEEYPLDVKRVERVIGRTANEWLTQDVARIVGMMKAVEDGMALLDETFPPVEAATPVDAAPADESVESFAAQQEPAAVAKDAAGEASKATRERERASEQAPASEPPAKEPPPKRKRRTKAEMEAAAATPPEIEQDASGDASASEATKIADDTATPASEPPARQQGDVSRETAAWPRPKLMEALRTLSQARDAAAMQHYWDEAIQPDVKVLSKDQYDLIAAVHAGCMTHFDQQDGKTGMKPASIFGVRSQLKAAQSEDALTIVYYTQVEPRRPGGSAASPFEQIDYNELLALANERRKALRGPNRTK